MSRPTSARPGSGERGDGARPQRLAPCVEHCTHAQMRCRSNRCRVLRRVCFRKLTTGNPRAVRAPAARRASSEGLKGASDGSKRAGCAGPHIALSVRPAPLGASRRHPPRHVAFLRGNAADRADRGREPCGRGGCGPVLVARSRVVYMPEIRQKGDLDDAFVRVVTTLCSRGGHRRRPLGPRLAVPVRTRLQPGPAREGKPRAAVAGAGGVAGAK